FTDSGVRFLKAENVGLYDVYPEPRFCVSESTHQTLSRSALRKNDILVVIAGATTGRAAIMPFSLLPANTNQAVSFIRLRDQGWANFIQYWISTSFVQNLVALNSVQSAQPNLSMEELG